MIEDHLHRGDKSDARQCREASAPHTMRRRLRSHRSSRMRNGCTQGRWSDRGLSQYIPSAVAAPLCTPVPRVPFSPKSHDIDLCALRGLRRPMKPEPNARSLQRNHAGVPESRKSLWNPPEARVFSMTALDEQDRLVPADGFRSALQGRSLMALNIDFHEVDWVMLS